MSPKIAAAEYDLVKCDADIKRLQAQLELMAAANGHKIELKALEVGFEEWRTKMVNMREEKKRYGA